jgi:hypothetical protein
MSVFRSLLVMMLGVGLIATPALAVDPAAQAFVEQIYAQYRGANSRGVALDGDAALKRYFEPSLVALLVKDQQEAEKKGEVPRLDGDPFIDAQDWQITDVKTIIADTGKDRARATVTFRNFKKPKTVTLDLVKVEGAWKIYDIHWPETTLRKLLSSP